MNNMDTTLAEAADRIRVYDEMRARRGGMDGPQHVEIALIRGLLARVQELEAERDDWKRLALGRATDLYAKVSERAEAAEAKAQELERELAEVEALMESRSMEIVKVTEDNIRLEREIEECLERLDD